MTDKGTPLLSIANASVSYGHVRALQNIDLTIARGEIVALVGSNGAGKTTLIRSLVGLLPLAEGEITFEGAAVSRVPVHKRVKRGIGYSPEGRRVFPGLSVRENLEVASQVGTSETARLVEQVYSIFPALEQKADSLGWTLSGGQQQMLAIGRALMMKPKLLLLDEPSLGLSPKLTDEVLFNIPKIVAGGTATLLAEQNMVKALEIADRAYVLRNGWIVQHGAAGDLKRDPNIRDAFLGGH